MMVGERMSATLTDEGRTMAARLAASHRSPDEWAAIAQATPGDLTDEERIATEYVLFSGKYDDLTGEQARAKAQELAPLVAAVRTALLPAVPPLGPGETVTIQDCMAPVTSLRLEQFGLNEHILQVAVMRRGQDDPAAFAVIGRVGAAQVREACDRFLAAHNDQPEDTEAAFFGPAQGEITVRGKFSGYQRLVPLIAPEDAEGLENG